jgi:predicted nuclease of predicted toxin-antitoxin system
MRIKLDENLPDDLRPAPAALGHDVDTVAEEGLRGRLDPDLWIAAQASHRFFITQDMDFSDVRQFKPGTHYGLMLLRLEAVRRERIDCPCHGDCHPILIELGGVVASLL